MDGIMDFIVKIAGFLRKNIYIPKKICKKAEDSTFNMVRKKYFFVKRLIRYKNHYDNCKYIDKFEYSFPRFLCEIRGDFVALKAHAMTQSQRDLLDISSRLGKPTNVKLQFLKFYISICKYFKMTQYFRKYQNNITRDVHETALIKRTNEFIINVISLLNPLFDLLNNDEQSKLINNISK